MQRRHDLCALSHRCRDSLNRPRTDVAHGEQPGHTSFEWPHAIFSSDDKAFGVERYAHIGKPVRVRIDADERKQVPYWMPRLYSRCVAPPNALEHTFIAFEPSD